MKKSVFILKGNIIYTETPGKFTVFEHSYLVCRDGKTEGIYPTLPFRLGGNPIRDFGDCLIIPGLTDLHIHAPQYSVRGFGMDLELLDWLEENAFPEEARYEDTEYAARAYRIFTDSLRKSAVTRACVFATVHRPAVMILMDTLEKSGLETFVGKVNMDRNCPGYIGEETVESLCETVGWLRDVNERGYQHTRPILTPRFIPACSDALMEGLKKIQVQQHLPVQSHLSENPQETAWVKELCPDAEFYGDAYDRFGLFGGEGCPTVMAHCVYSDDREIARMKERGIYIAHCPESNMNLSSGIAPVRRFLEDGMHVGLGSDVAGGTTENLFRAMACAVQVSKLRWRLADQKAEALTAEEVFYMASKGGGAFFGKTRSFEKGYDFDAVVLDDSRLKSPRPLDVRSRLERMIYLADEREIRAKFVKGQEISL